MIPGLIKHDTAVSCYSIYQNPTVQTQMRRQYRYSGRLSYLQKGFNQVDEVNNTPSPH